jgi:hypothetical protein
MGRSPGLWYNERTIPLRRVVVKMPVDMAASSGTGRATSSSIASRARNIEHRNDQKVDGVLHAEVTRQHHTGINAQGLARMNTRSCKEHRFS